VACVGAGSLSHANPNSEPSHKNSQRFLKAERDGYRAVFDLNPQPLLLCDVGTLRVLAANQQAAKLHGVSPEQLVGISLFDLRRVSDLTSVMLKRAAGREVALGFGYHLRKDGSTFPVQLSAHPSELAGRPVWLCVLKSLEDVLLPREGEQERRLCEAVGHLAGGVAHDINNLLAVVLSFASLASAQLPEGSATHTDLSEIRGAAERASTLTKQLLSLSRKAPAAPKPLQLNELLTRVEKVLRRLVDEQLTIELNLDPELDQVMADATQVERLLVQLVSEARHGSPPGSRLSIETRNVALELEHGKERHVMLAVNDSGGSLSPEVAAMSSFVEAASSWLECDPGSGTRFVAWFPSLKVVRLGGSLASERRKSRPETVLIVQDNPHLRKTLKTYFVREGYGVIEADSSGEAVRIVERDARIELLLTDFSLPDGNGADLTRALRQQLPELTSLITISHPEQRAAVREDSRTATISKPFDLQPFGELVQRLLDAPRESQP
jgi:two-component system, cell cycle sensor histidine kinase and response regulator CckA